MGKQISYAISCIFYVSIVLLHVLVINSKAELPTAYFKGRGITWKEAKNSCKLIELFEKIQVSNNINGEYGQYGWVDASVEYTPWVEYKKCYRVKPEDIVKSTVVKYGNQLQECLQFCKAYTYIGLQQAKCVCLGVNETDIITAGSICQKEATEPCKIDKFLYCANDIISPDGFIIYKSGNINTQFGAGNCLAVISSDGNSKRYEAYQCGNTFSSLCTPDSETVHIQAFDRDWISSTKHCSLHNLISYNAYKKLDRIDRGYFWLANIRRPIIRNGTREEDLNQTYCIAVTVGKTNHKVTWLVRSCTHKLSAICDDKDMNSSHETPSTITATTSYETHSTITLTSSYETHSTITMKDSTRLDKKENRTNQILLISLIITAVLALAVIIAVISFYKRRTSLRSGHRQFVVPSNEVTYAQVNKPTEEKVPVHAGESTRNNTADDTYDHMEHHRLSQNQIPTESNYDTMQSVGHGDLENDYDVTGGTDRPRQIVVDDTAEYSHVEVVNQEVKVVAT